MCAEQTTAYRRESPMKKRCLYYKTESDDFFKTDKPLPKIDESYIYIKRGFWHKAITFFLYRIIATPCALFYSRFILRDKFIGKEKLKKYKRQGFFIYSNHTQAIGDAFTPNIFLFPKRVYVVVGKDNLALPIIGKRTSYLGAIPTPDNLRAAINFNQVLSERIKEGAAVVIYPEAHVWPYYTGLRDFSINSLEPPIREGSPVFTAARVYKSRGNGKRPRSLIYIDGPFIPDPSLPKKERRERLGEEVREALKARVCLSDTEYIEYIKED